MKKDQKHLSLRIDSELLRKFSYVAEYDALSMNWLLNSFVKKYIAEFEKQHGKIPDKDEQ